MTNGLDPDLQAPLARLWREVYRRAAGVAEGRTVALVNDHVYRYHPDGVGGGTVAGPYVDEVGDTMTGTLHFDGSAPTVAGGAVAVVGQDTPPTGPQLFGPGSPTFAPGVDPYAGTMEHAVRFRVASASVVQRLAWYRTTAPQVKPQRFRLWDGASSVSDPPLWEWFAVADTGALGWQATDLAPADRPRLDAGRDYVLGAWYDGVGGYTYHTGYAPVPQAPITYLANQEGHPAGTYPALPSGAYYGLDLTLVASVALLPPAHHGAVRLPYGITGRIAWRNAADTADHWIAFDADGNFVADGVVLGGGGGGGGGNTTMYTQTGTPTGGANSLWFNPSESA